MPIFDFGAVTLPAAATHVNASGTGAASAATATLPAVATKTTYISGFMVHGLGATAAIQVALTIANIVGGTATYYVGVPAGVTTPLTPVVVDLPFPIPATAVNTTIVVTLPSFGSGNTASGVSATGFQL